ncbi:hypothetical protein D3C80_1635610 [compost metagenome]
MNPLLCSALRLNRRFGYKSHFGAGPAEQLAAVRLAFLNQPGNLLVFESKCFAQHKNNPFRRGQPLQQNEHRVRQEISLYDRFHRIAFRTDKRLRQPFAEILLPFPACRLVQIAAAVRHHFAQISFRFSQPLRGHIHYFQKNVLNGILGIGNRPGQLIGKLKQ